MPPEGASRSEPGPVADSGLRRLLGVFVFPARTFASIATRPTWLLPVALAAGLSLPLSELILSKTDWRAVVTQQLAKGSRSLSESQLDGAIDRARRLSWVWDIIAVLAPVIVTFAVAAVLWASCQAFGWEVRFRQSLGVTSHAFVPGLLGSAALFFLLWNRATVDPQTVGDTLPSHLGFLVDAKADRLTHGLLASFDLFSFWSMGLLVLGLSAAAKASRGRMAALVVSLWALFVLGKTGLIALLG